MLVAAPTACTSAPPSDGPARVVTASVADVRLLRAVSSSLLTRNGSIVAVPTSNTTEASPTTSATTTSCATVTDATHQASGTEARAAARIRSIAICVPRNGSRPTSTPAGSPTIAHAANPAAVTAPTSKLDACARLRAASGSATVVTAVPTRLTVEPAQ